jgi:hypothetical protein
LIVACPRINSEERVTTFDDTSNWEKKDGTTLVYSYTHKGKQHEGSSEKEPNSLLMQLERLSVLGETSWRFENEKEPDSKTSYFTREYISALGVLNGCRVHAITLDETENEVFTRLDVTIYPIELRKLQETSTFDQWSFSREGERPEDGWLKDEIGRIDYHGMDEYYDRSLLSARLFLETERFDELVEEIRAGGIRSARLQVLADLYQFGWEGMVADIPGSTFNYAILCEYDGKGARGYTNARLQEVLLEWSPTLATRTAAARDEPDEGEFLEPKMEPEARDVEKVVARLARDVQVIRGRVDIFYQAAIVVILILVLSRVLDWVGF